MRKTEIAILICFILHTEGCNKVQKQELHNITIGIQANTVTAMVLVARARNYFAQQGLNATVVDYPSGKLAFRAMLENEIDFATVADMPISTASLKRNDFKIFCSIAKSQNGAWIIARRDKGIVKPADLRWKTIGTQKDSAVHFFLDLFLLDNKIPKSQLNIKYLKAVDLPGALVRGDIDAFSMRNPFILEAKNKLGKKAIEFKDNTIYLMTFNLTCRNRYINENPLVIEKVLRALKQAENFILKNRDESIRITSSRLSGSGIREVSADWNSFQFILSLEQSLLATLENQAGWIIDNEKNKNVKFPNFLEFIYTDALLKVSPESVSIFGASEGKRKK